MAAARWIWCRFSFTRPCCAFSSATPVTSDAVEGGTLHRVQAFLDPPTPVLAGVACLRLSNAPTVFRFEHIPKVMDPREKTAASILTDDIVVEILSRSSQTSSDIFRFIVCNPATREWRILPDAQRKPDTFYYTIKLGFDPAMSPHFCVFNFRYDRGPANLVLDLNQVEMFSSRNSTWLVYHDLLDQNNFISVSGRPHVFLDGYLHAHTDRDVWVLEELKTPHIGRPPSNWTIELPLHREDCCADHCFRGCLGQSRGTLHYAAAEEDGRTVSVWSHDYFCPNGWTVEHRLSMSDVLGRDDFVHYEDGWIWACNYEIIAIDMERKILFLTDNMTNMLLSCNISTGKLTEIKDSTHWYFYYVACCLKLPAPDSDIYDDEDI
ncbi:hypothetical protein PR202_gn00787 [Eleusine coracana subsp. coracana]|uniref:DUF1618 domain-containing protein n=1 Tax=Eleusine coracana subsp. coracana TaxID=191504 RepID=A0AAV5G553_ELECO|nr:hypothetical protein PR202_gn00787 [Eleusine coracana subsp. coracana]